MKPLVTVIIPSFNHAQYVEKAIESVLSQDYENFELIVIDDGSKDNSHAVLSSILPNSRLHIVLNTLNKGQSAVLNEALLLAHGEFICLLPSDDWYTPRKLSLQVEKFLESDKNVGVIYGKGLRYFSDTHQTLPVNLPLYRGWVLEYLVKGSNFIVPITPMFRKECFEFARPDESYKAEGEAIYLKLAIKYKFDYVDQVLGVMRDHVYNTGKKSAMMYEDNFRYWTDFFSRKDLPESIKKLKNIPISRLHRLKGLEYVMIEKKFSMGRTALIKSICLRPLYIFDYRVVMGIIFSIIPEFIAIRVLDLKRSNGLASR